MKRTLVILLAALATVSCSALRDLGSDDKNPYDAPFYAKYLNTGSLLDAQITRTLAALRNNPESPELHNALGALLVEKRFPSDAEREFERAIDINRKFYPAWYNLGLVRAANGDELGARRAFGRTVALKPGHAAALFQLGLVEEKRNHTDRAIRLYAKAFSINPALLDVGVNPRILDTRLADLALLRLYPIEHARRSMQLQGAPMTARVTQPPPQAPSPQAPAASIVTPTAPTTDPAKQPAPRPPL
jgi:tetratricopeptide (TPR) repeat protein